MAHEILVTTQMPYSSIPFLVWLLRIWGLDFGLGLDFASGLSTIKKILHNIILGLRDEDHGDSGDQKDDE